LILDTTLAATSSLHTLKSFLQSLHIFHGFKTVTNRSCLLTVSNTATSISSCFVCLPCLNNWHSLPFSILLLHPTMVLWQYTALLVQC